MEIQIQTPSKHYPVYIGNHTLVKLDTLFNKHKYTKLMVITDKTVARLHLHKLKSVLPKHIDVCYYEVPSGEMAKQFSVFENCLTYALQNGLDRKSCIIAFGGGAVGDLAGFVAASYMRGIAFLQVPTTILAHDSAVGGKTAINHPLGKNMIGAFHQPDAVIYQTSFLRSLPDAEIRSGFAEVVKHALIADPQFLKYLMNNIDDLQSISDDKLNGILKRGIEIKADVVSIDERESGLREILNFGHTLGHVIELNRYGAITHGESVMIGMFYALHLSKRTLGLKFPFEEFTNWIDRLGYQLNLPQDLQFDQAFESMKRDKKSFASKPRFVLLEEIGKPVVKEIDKSILEETFYYLKS